MFDNVNRDAMWKVLEMYGVNENLLERIKCLYAESEAYVSVHTKEGLV